MSFWLWAGNKILGLIGKSDAIKSLPGIVAEQQKIHLAKQQLYREMAEDYEKLLLRRTAVTRYEGIKRGSVERFPRGLNLRFDIYDHYWTDSEKVLFKLPEAGAISAIYGQFKGVDDFEDDGYAANRKAMEAIADFDRYVRQKKLDLKVLKEVCSPKLWEYINELLEGKRKSHELDLDPIP